MYISSHNYPIVSPSNFKLCYIIIDHKIHIIFWRGKCKWRQFHICWQKIQNIKWRVVIIDRQKWKCTKVYYPPINKPFVWQKYKNLYSELKSKITWIGHVLLRNFLLHAKTCTTPPAYPMLLRWWQLQQDWSPWNSEVINRNPQSVPTLLPRSKEPNLLWVSPTVFSCMLIVGNKSLGFKQQRGWRASETNSVD